MEIYDNQIMNFESFKDSLIAGLQEHYGNEERVVVGSIVKPKIGRLTSIRLEKPDMTLMPTLYVENLYEDYVRRGSFLEVLDKTANTLSMIPEGYHEVALPNFRDPNVVMERAFCQVVGVKGNEALLDTVPHKRHEDLAVIYRMLIEKRDNEVGSVKITNDNFNDLGISLDELHERALANTEKFFPVKIMNLAEMRSIEEARDNRSSLLALTNEGQSLGAIAAFYPGVLEHISEVTGGDLFLLPSSVNEFMVLYDNGDYDAKWLRGIVREANRLVIREEDHLTDSVYRFRRGDKALSLCKDENRRSRGRDDR